MPSNTNKGINVSLRLRTTGSSPVYGSKAVREVDNVAMFVWSGVDAAIEKAIDTRRAAVHLRVSQLVSGSQRTGVARNKTNSSPANSMLGVEIPPISKTSNAIGQVTSRMKKGLSSQSVPYTELKNLEKTTIPGDGSYAMPHPPTAAAVIGWGPAYDPWNNLFSNNAIDYRASDERTNPDFLASSQQFDTKPVKDPDFLDTSQPAELYVWEVLLGSLKFTGRNVLRLALLQEIMSGQTETEVAKEVKLFFGRGEIANFRRRSSFKARYE